MWLKSKFEKAMARGVKKKDIWGPLSDVGCTDAMAPYRIDRLQEVKAICDALDQVLLWEMPERLQNVSHLCTFMENVVIAEGLDLLATRAFPQLLHVFEEGSKCPGADPWRPLTILLVFGRFHWAPGLTALVKAAKAGLASECVGWHYIFHWMGETTFQEVCKELGGALPGGYITTGLMEKANALSLEGKLPHHPFDSPEGRQAIEGWLKSKVREERDLARQATMALAFAAKQDRKMLAVAKEHADTDVQMEAAWAAAKRGDESGVKILAESCLDCGRSIRATKYLRELDMEDRIPAAALNTDFRATAELCDWLSHPMEFGRPPDHIELLDTREVEDRRGKRRRQLRMFRFSYTPRAPSDHDCSMLGMTGGASIWDHDLRDGKPTVEQAYAMFFKWDREWERRNP